MQRQVGVTDGKARGPTLGTLIKKDEELALFLEMRRREECSAAASAADQFPSLWGRRRQGTRCCSSTRLHVPVRTLFWLFLGLPSAVPLHYCYLLMSSGQLSYPALDWFAVALVPKQAV
jgi:hypothetical protein